MTESVPSPDSGQHSHVARELPDPNICHTRPIGSIKTFASCLVGSPIGCPYVVNIAGDHFCEHLHWKQFVRQPDYETE